MVKVEEDTAVRVETTREVGTMAAITEEEVITEVMEGDTTVADITEEMVTEVDTTMATKEEVSMGEVDI